jgi:hypothetical protein
LSGLEFVQQPIPFETSKSNLGSSLTFVALVATQKVTWILVFRAAIVSVPDVLNLSHANTARNLQTIHKRRACNKFSRVC